MGDLQVCSRRPDAIVIGEDRLFLSSPPPLSQLPASNPDPALISAHSWVRAEQATREILRRTQPTLLADHNRKEVMDYVQRLIRGRIGYEVFPYGSFPLKTYLPDGDIDLTALGSPNIEDALVSDVHSALKGEELNEAAQYEVKDVHCIDAEVKLVKCIVQNIVVDISFNQLGGLCTLCFLEQVDSLVGKDHLFKRSIILIKAWCYYESRILGAHHGLISTYALETLVLYIFHMFHSSLSGPLEVLYRFLDYFSKFDWENYCLSLNGPVCKASLPDIVVDVSENGGDDVLLSEEFLKKCVDMFSVPLRGLETNLRGFPLKHLNVIDPLKENNNLGRSVNKGNFYRIRSAFKYGTRKLGSILSLPGERMSDELKKFFSNTLERQENNYGIEALDLTLTSGSRGSDYLSLSSFSRMCLKDKISPISSIVGFSNDNIQEIEVAPKLGFRNEKTCLKVFSSEAVQELDSYADVKDVSGYRLVRAAKEHAFFRSLGMRSKNVSSDHFPLRTGKGTSRDLAGTFRGSEALESLLDLSGDYDSHIKSLLYGQYCHGHALSVAMLPSPPTSPQLQDKSQCETIHQSIQLTQNDYSQTNKNGAIVGRQLHCTNSSAPCNAGFGSEEKKKPRGTGTFFPRMNYRSFRDRPLQGGIRNPVSGNHSNSRNISFTTASEDMSIFEEDCNELSADQFPVLGHGLARSSDSHQSHSFKLESSRASGFSCPTEILDFKSFGCRPRGASLPEDSNQRNSSPPCIWGSAVHHVEPAVQNPTPVLENNQESFIEQSYHLRDEDDFPPLSL